MTQTRLPVLDLTLFHAGGASRQRFLQQLRHAARELGFFYLSGHGVSPRLEQDVLAVARDFFAGPQAEKERVAMIHSPHFRGYTRAGGELTRGKPDWREQFDVMREALASGRDDGDQPWRRLHGPNQWPATLPHMRDTILAWLDSLTEVGTTLLRAFAIALEQDEHAFDHTIGDGPFQHLKLIRYPGRDAADSDQGVGAHKDAGYLTLVLQGDEPGLEVLLGDEWIPVTPIPGTFVVNIGELLELASNGYLKATLHRVLSPPPGVARLSTAFFMAAQLDAEVPLLQLPPHLAAEAKGPASDPANPLFYQVGRNVLKARLRSHVDVAHAHYGGLEAVL